MTSGIYKLYFNQNPSSCYIGSSGCIERRFREHKRELNQNKHYNPILSRAYCKYGPDNLQIAIIEECDINYLLQREQYYIDNINPKYNIRETAQGGKSKDYYVFYDHGKFSLIHGIKHNNFPVPLQKLRNYSRYYVITPEGYFYRRFTQEELNLGYFFRNKTGYAYIGAYNTTKQVVVSKNQKIPKARFYLVKNKVTLFSSYSLEEVLFYRDNKTTIYDGLIVNGSSERIPSYILDRYK